MAAALPAPDSMPTVPQASPGPEHDAGHAPTPSRAEAPATGGQLLTTPEGPSTAQGPPAPLPGGGRYQLLGELARGGMGVVYKVRDSVLGRVVALKAVRSGDQLRPEDVLRFHREAEVVARLDHPHIIRLHEFGEEQGRPYFTMPLAEGGSLAGRLAEFSRPRAAVALAEKVARAVGFAHAAGILHRDLKPSNVLLDSAGEPLVADFGLAKFVGRPTDLTHTGAVMGTPAYMAPEQAAGRLDEVGPAADVWALGAILYELLTGRPPFPGRNREEILHRILSTTPPPPRSLKPELAPAVEAVVLRCLRPEPGERYPTATELADDLARWLHDDTLPLPPAPPTRRRWLRGVVAAGGLAVAGGLGAVLPRRTSDDPDPTKRPVSRDVLLIGDEGPVRQVRWLARRGNVTTSRHPGDAAFTVRATEFALLELLETLPWPAFRLEAIIRHDEIKRGGIGLTFTHRHSISALGGQWCFCRLGFNDGQHNGQVTFRGSCWEDIAVSHGWSIGGVTRRIPPPWSPGRYHDLALEVTDEEVRVFFDGWYRERIPTARIHHMPREKRDSFGRIPWKVIRSGGVGVVVDRGSASFRRVVVKPLS